MNFKIVKDPEVDIFFVVTKFSYDEENVFSILGKGKTEKDALEHTLERVLDNNKKLEKMLEHMRIFLGEDDPRYFLDSITVDLPRDVDPKLKEEVRLLAIKFEKEMGPEFANYSDTRTCTEFHTMFYCKNEKKWYRYYR